MKEIPTPLTDKLHKHLVKLSEDQRTWIKGKDYVDMREHARQLERDRHELIGALHQILLDEKRDDDDPLLIETRVMCNSLLERMKP